MAVLSPVVAVEHIVITHGGITHNIHGKPELLDLRADPGAASLGD